MHRYTYLFAGSLVVAAAPALAGEEILYQPAPEWVDRAELPPSDSEPGKPIRLMESQVRLNGGTVWEFRDMAVALDTPLALSQFGTITANWSPDKGDLIVHRVQIVRDEGPLDVLAGGARFEVLRREQQLEQRIVNGRLTATLAVPGLRVGDTLRVAYSITKRDQALGDEMEWRAFVMADPMPIASGRIIASWPGAASVSHKALRVGSDLVVTEAGGMKTLTVEMPIAEPEEIPLDAPTRFRLPPGIQIGTFESWEAVSATMAPHYDPEGTISPDGPIAREIDKIRSATSDPLVRAALAVQLVQDEVGYLMNGLDGGNYLPQSPALTWEKRFGDCKAKSLLLLAILRELDISSEVVLVATEGGGALPDMLPLPGNFNHMIVRADIGGEPYWLDGTSAGTRLETIGAAPRFGYALPLRAGGAPLQEIAMRPRAVPDRTVRMTVDQRAGIGVPALFDFELTVNGQFAAALRMLTQMEDGEQRDGAIYGAVAAIIGPHQEVEKSVTYDDEAGTATIAVDGIMTTPWSEEDGRYRLDVPYQPASEFSFDIDRARAEWRDLPVIVNGPLFWRSEIVWLLPDEGEGFSIRGEASFENTIGGNVIRSTGGIEGERFELTQDLKSLVWEFPADQLAAVKRDTMRMQRRLPKLIAPVDVRRAWEYLGDDKKMLDGIEAAYSALVEQEEEDEIEAYFNRASFYAGTGDWASALADLDVVVERQPSSENHVARALAKRQLGDLAGALADLEEAERLNPSEADHQLQIELLGQMGRGDEALALAEESALVAADPDWADIQLAYAEGWAGQYEKGLARLTELAEIAPAESAAHNALCWYSGIWDMATSETLPFCLKAIEQAAGSVAALDSRALVLFRLGRAEEALVDLNKALAVAPGQHASRYLRGIVRLGLGDEAGQRDIATALAAEPALKDIYRAYGVTPPAR